MCYRPVGGAGEQYRKSPAARRFHGYQKQNFKEKLKLIKYKSARYLFATAAHKGVAQMLRSKRAGREMKRQATRARKGVLPENSSIC